MDMFREQFKFNLMARDGRPLASKTTTKVPVPFVVVRSARLLLVIVLAGGIISAGGEGLHCGVFCREPFCRIGLIVLALAIAVVGAGAVGMAFLPAAVTEPVVKPVTQSVELLTGDDKPETITVDFDEQPAVLGISNYPRIQLGAMRYTTDASLIDRASELLKGKTFKRWYGYASYRAKANDMVGGCRSSIELDTANGAKLCDVSYDPGYEGNEGPGIYIMDGDVAYVMEGDQTELNDFMGQCIQDAYKQTCLPDPQTARDSGSARTWLFEDEMPWTVESGSTGSAKE